MPFKPIQFLETNRVKLSFTNKAITAYGGFALLAKLFEKLDLHSNVERMIPFRELSPNSTGPFAKILRFGLTVIAGGRRFSHTMFLGDALEIYETEFGLKRIPKSISAVTRFFRRIKSLKMAEQLSEKLWSYTFGRVIPFSEIAGDYLTFDSSVITRYGGQEGALSGYNPRKKARPSHHPLIGFLNRTKYVVNLWNRSGNASSGNGCVEFAKQTWERIASRMKILGVLADSAFYQIGFVDFIDGKLVPYVIAARLSRVIQNEIAKITQWKAVDSRISVAEFNFQHGDQKWKKKRRYIVVRQQWTVEKPRPAGRQLSFFEKDENFSRYRYGCFITSHAESPEEIWRTYRLRAGDEGIIRENKEDFALDGFSLDTFYAVEAAMLFRVLFYNIVNLFRSKCLGDDEKRQTLSTLRLKYLLVPAVLGRDGKDIVLRLGVRTQKIRQKILWIIGQLDRIFPKRIAFGPAV